MWEKLSLGGMSEKYLKIINILCESYTAKIEHNRQLVQQIKIESGVR